MKLGQGGNPFQGPAEIRCEEILIDAPQAFIGVSMSVVFQKNIPTKSKPCTPKARIRGKFIV
jgi:hypothetical protein